MSGVKHFALVVSLAAVLSAYESVAQPSVAPPQEASDYWECVDSIVGYPTLVRAWVFSDPDLLGRNGVVEANGIRKDAWYLQEGLSHRWNFDPDQDKGSYSASFVIELDGDGKYYLFGSEDTAKPSIITKCTKYR